MNPTNRQPLFIITGASCVGKSTLCSELFQNEKEYIVMESDLLWSDIYNTPDDDYCEYNRLWLRVCANISQAGKPVVLCGCRVPKQLENLPERKLFTDIHYLAVVCDDTILKERMCKGRGVNDENWLGSSLDFNKWLKQHANDAPSSPITLLDTSGLLPAQAARIADDWIMDKIRLTIKPLSPELYEDWLFYFDNIAFKDHGDWAFCYCLEGHLDPKTQIEWTNPGERRAKAIKLIQAGEMQGYLAYLGDKVIGWCNTNDREKYRYLSEMFQKISYQPEDAADTKVKAIYCFLIAPEYRQKGVAQSLLNRVCEDAARDGYTYVEAYPFADEKFEFQYHGSSKMYERNGFVEAADLKYIKIMRKKLS